MTRNLILRALGIQAELSLSQFPKEKRLRNIKRQRKNMILEDSGNEDEGEDEIREESFDLSTRAQERIRMNLRRA